ncbi:SDR family NAD(P)-dependent oxidoreductase, partial [Candidatus Saccharibacteria bacterium]|nr:SDR family NAD(P)-dependent oxidoreductase [Candidatus Saccharibacteria bacterium]
MKVADKVFVVTGAGGGIGGELVLELLHRGARVAAVDLRPEGLERLASRYDGPSDSLSTHAVDITDKAAVAKLPAGVIKCHGSVDGLVNCAGIIQPFVRVNDLDYEAIDRVMNVNFYG